MQLTSLFAPLLLALLQVLSGPPAHAPRYQAGDTLASYVGTWVGHTPTGEFTLVLEERKQFSFLNSPAVDVLLGRHAYVTPDGPVNESLSLPADKLVLMCSVDDNKPDGLSGTFYDDVNRRGVNIRLSFADAAKTQLVWAITGLREAWSLDPSKPILPGVSVPTSLVLTKVK